MTYALGVDIGTSFTAAAAWRGRTAETITLGNEATATPSVLLRQDDGSFVIGQAARAQAAATPERIARNFKVHMGQRQPLPVGGAQFQAHELTGTLLRWVLQKAVATHGGQPAHVTLTHPATWAAHRLDALVEAAAIAGMRHVGLLPEPVAAATWFAAHTAGEPVRPGSTIGVYDLGGGTFDATVVRKTVSGFVIEGAPSGIEDLGGTDFDHLLSRHVLERLGVVDELDESDPAVVDLLDKVVQAKEHLSSLTETVIPVFLPGVPRTVTVTRADFEALIHDDVVRSVDTFGYLLERAGVAPADLDTAVLVGGSSRIPLITRLLRQRLGVRVAGADRPGEAAQSSYTTYAVCLGAAIAAAPRLAAAASASSTASASSASSTASTVGEEPVPASVGRPTEPVPAAVEDPVERPSTVVDAPVERLSTVEEPVGEGPAPAPVEVDLAGSGLARASDVDVQTPERVSFVAPPVYGTVSPLMRTRDAPAPRRGLLAVAAVVVLALLLVGATIVLSRRSSGNTDSGAPGDRAGTTAAAPDGAAAGAATGAGVAAGEVIAAPDGADEMRAVVALPGGDVVAVGSSIDQHPRAWLRRAGKPWTVVTVPAPATGGVLDVTADRRGLLAAGWVTAGAGPRPAVWRSKDGAAWERLPAVTTSAAEGLGPVTAVLGTPGGYLAAVADRRADATNGDTALLRSADGVTWQPAAANGWGGAGPQEVHRMARLAAGTLVAIGAQLVGGHRAPAVWTSADGADWQSQAAVPDGSPTLWGLLPRPDGTLVACGDTMPSGPDGDSTTGCWVLTGGVWLGYRVMPRQGSPAPTNLYGLTDAGGTLLAVGVARAAGSVDAGWWTVQLDPPK